MSYMLIVLICFIAMVAFLLYQVAIKNETWMTTFSIILGLGLCIMAAFAIYENQGYAKEVNIFQEKWILHYVMSVDESNTFLLLVEEKGKRPRLVSYKISKKEKYESQKKELTQAQNSVKNGVMIEGEFNSETDEFKFYEYSMKKSNPKQ